MNVYTLLGIALSFVAIGLVGYSLGYDACARYTVNELKRIYEESNNE